jgi:hypothetical protein
VEHPYRAPDPTNEAPGTQAFEARLLVLVLVLSGLLGVGLGLGSPREHALELVAGLALVALGLVTLRASFFPRVGRRKGRSSM